MNPALLNFLSGPINALIRYGVTAAAGAVVSKGWLDAGTTGQVAAAVIGLAAAGIGALTSTKAAKLSTTAALPEVQSIRLNSGETITDPTWDNPNAR